MAFLLHFQQNIFSSFTAHARLHLVCTHKRNMGASNSNTRTQFYTTNPPGLIKWSAINGWEDYIKQSGFLKQKWRVVHATEGETPFVSVPICYSLQNGNYSVKFAKLIGGQWMFLAGTNRVFGVSTTILSISKIRQGDAGMYGLCVFENGAHSSSRQLLVVIPVEVRVEVRNERSGQ